MRDLRAVDPAFTVSNAPALLVRRNALLVNMYTIKAIILTKRCYFFLKEGADGEVLAMREWLGPGTSSKQGPHTASGPHCLVWSTRRSCAF